MHVRACGTQAESDADALEDDLPTVGAGAGAGARGSRTGDAGVSCWDQPLKIRPSACPRPPRVVLLAASVSTCNRKQSLRNMPGNLLWWRLRVYSRALARGRARRWREYDVYGAESPCRNLTAARPERAQRRSGQLRRSGRRGLGLRTDSIGGCIGCSSSGCASCAAARAQQILRADIEMQMLATPPVEARSWARETRGVWCAAGEKKKAQVRAQSAAARCRLSRCSWCSPWRARRASGR